MPANKSKMTEVTLAYGAMTCIPKPVWDTMKLVLNWRLEFNAFTVTVGMVENGEVNVTYCREPVVWVAKFQISTPSSESVPLFWVELPRICIRVNIEIKATTVAKKGGNEFVVRKSTRDVRVVPKVLLFRNASSNGRGSVKVGKPKSTANCSCG